MNTDFNKTIYTFYWLKYLLTDSQQSIVTSLLRHICVLFIFNGF